MKAARLAIMSLLVLANLARAGVYRFTVPSDDRWHYPFNFNPAGRATASCFGSTGDPNFTTFNDRDGIYLIAWRTDAAVPTGLPAAAYDVQAVCVILTHTGGTPGSPVNWPVDLTSDEWFTMDYPIADADAGQPLELFGVGFGPSHTYADWNEGSPYVGGDDQVFTPGDPFPFMYQDATTDKVHVEDNVKDEFTPQPWTIGVPVNYTPGSQMAPFAVNFDVNLLMSSGNVGGFFREQLAGGRVFVAITSLQVTFKQASSGYPTFFCKEGAPLAPGGQAPIIELTLAPNGDVTGNGVRDLADAGSLEKCLGGPDMLPLTGAPLTTDTCLFLFDMDEDGDVDLTDYGIFARRFP